jgi:succinate dehydrogenase / fumarate reductase cytochrome b subunit
MRGLVGFPKTSIGRKQLVAGTGVLLLVFVIGHLVGNFYIYAGPETYNGYAKVLSSLRPALYFVEAGLLLIAVIHISTAVLIVRENLRARNIRYAVSKSMGQQTLASRLMPFSGAIILAYVFLHIADFTFADFASRSTVNGEDLALYGVVYNSFTVHYHAAGYIIAMVGLGFHLTHAIQGALQTFGLEHPGYTPFIRKICILIGIVIALMFISIPVTIWLGIIKP